jgi:aerobic carbon-monoxide dehydrogenase small subunit
MQQALTVTVNDRRHSLDIDTRTTLVHMLREDLGLTGTHVGCATGSCGACTVMLGDQTVKSCCVLAADVNGLAITTIEALSSSAADLHPIQRAFVETQGLQCGYCTPGMVMATLQLLKKNPNPTEDEVRHGIAGNLCRCTGYQLIVEAVLEAARRGREPTRAKT